MLAIGAGALALVAVAAASAPGKEQTRLTAAGQAAAKAAALVAPTWEARGKPRPELLLADGPLA